MALPAGNLIVDHVIAQGETGLLRNARAVRLTSTHVTTVGERTMPTVDLPVTALVSVFGLLADGTTAELASIGPEGFVEIDAALRSTVAKRSAVCIFSGEAIRMPLADFQAAIVSSRRFADLICSAVRTRVFVTEQIELCNARHTVNERLSRWILLTAVRCGRDEFTITHEQMSSVLGVRRTTVSLAIAGLEREGGISVKRRTVRIAERAVLEAGACECYPVVRGAIRDGIAEAATY